MNQKAIPSVRSLEFDHGEPASFDFGDALRLLKSGQRVARSGWNGKGMWLLMIDVYDCYPVNSDKSIADMDIRRLPWIGMKTADGKFVPWLASQTDIMASDWMGA